MKLQIENVSKTYRGGVLALRDFSLEIKPGVLGRLGPNGAGKTTLMRLLCRLLTRASRRARLMNGTDLASDPDAVRSVWGIFRRTSECIRISARSSSWNTWLQSRALTPGPRRTNFRNCWIL